MPRALRCAFPQVEHQHREAAQKADSILNHILKNAMADAIGCIDVFCSEHLPDGAEALSRATDVLFRGMWWCKLREAMLKIIAGKYHTSRGPTDLQQFVDDVVRGRQVTASPCPAHVSLDPIACSIILDNAVTNALRHGCPGDQRVRISAELLAEGSADTLGERRRLRFLVTNRADPAKPMQQERWCSREPHGGFQKGAARPVLSDGLGLQHIALVARACDMVATLWQDGGSVLFELRLDTEVVAAPRAAGASPALGDAPPFPSGLSIMCLDDSPLARYSLGTLIPSLCPDVAVATFGEDAADAERFKPAALARANIVILDQNVDVPGKELLGTEVAAELLEEGYQGFLCIRSANSTEADVELSRRSGAHWHVSKDVPVPKMVKMLQREYQAFAAQGTGSGRTSSTSTVGTAGPKYMLPADPDPQPEPWSMASASSFSAIPNVLPGHV